MYISSPEGHVTNPQWEIFITYNAVQSHPPHIKFTPTFDACVNVLNTKQQSILYVACRFGTNEIVRLLLRNLKINVNTLNGDGSTPAIGAAFSEKHAFAESLLIIEALKEKGADLTITKGMESVVGFMSVKLEAKLLGP